MVNLVEEVSFRTPTIVSWVSNHSCNRKSISGQTLSAATTAVDDSRETPVPKLLRDPTAEGGIAHLEASYWQRSEGAPPRVQHFDVEIPGQWLLNALIKREEAVAQDSKKVNSVWKEFSQLPSDYRHAIGEHVQDKSDYGVNVWVLLHPDCMHGKRRHGILDRSSRGELFGVYVVLKQNRKPRPRSSERKDDENYLVHGRSRDADLSSPMTRRVSSMPRSRNKSSYTPRHNSKEMRFPVSIPRDNHGTRDVDFDDEDFGHHFKPVVREDDYPHRRSHVERSSDHAPISRRDVSFVPFDKEDGLPRSPQRMYRDRDGRYDERSAATFFPIPRRQRSRSRSRPRSPSPRPLRRSGTGRISLQSFQNVCQLITHDYR